MVNGEWSMVNGQWSIVNGEWSMVLDHIAFVGVTNPDRVYRSRF